MVRPLTIRTTIGMEASVGLLWNGVVTLASRVAVWGKLVGMRRGRRTAREEVVIRYRVGREVLAGSGASTTCTTTLSRDVGHLMSVLRIVHHLLISPLLELGIGRIVVRVLGMDLSWRRVAVHDVRLLVRVLVEGRVKLLLRMWRGPPCLLLLYRVWIRLLLGHGGRRWGVIVGGGRALSWKGVVGRAG